MSDTATMTIARKEAEAAVLGACMADTDAIIFVAPELKPMDFTVPVNRWIADAIWQCFERRTPPTMAAVIDRLQAMGRWSESVNKNAVTMRDLDAILEAISEADVEHAVSNAQLIHEASFRRNGYTTVSKAASVFYDQTLTVPDIQKSVLASVGKVFDGMNGRDAAVSSIGAEERQRIDAMGDSELPGSSCGISWLDGLTGGLLPAETWVIAAPYKMRKTTLALNIVLSVARASVPVDVFTVGDSSRDATYRKLLAMIMNQIQISERTEDKAPISSKTLQYKLRDPYYVQLRDRAARVLHSYPIRLYDGRDMVGNLPETARILRRDVAMAGTRVFVYDYAQAANYGVNDYERTTYIAGWVQQIIGELGITGVIISQLNEAAISQGASDSYSPGAKGGGALPAAANVFITTRYAEPLLTVELKLARDAKMGDKVTHKLLPATGLILDPGQTRNINL